MVLLVLLALGLMGVVAAWEKHLPSVDERLDDLSTKRRAWSIAAIPISVVAIAAFAFLLVGFGGARNDSGYGKEALVFLCGLGAVGFSYLLIVAVSRINKARQHRSDADR